MSALDKAFIKAYRKEPGPAPPGPSDPSASTLPQSSGDGPELCRAAAVTESSSDDADYRIDARHAELPGPHPTVHDPIESSGAPIGRTPVEQDPAGESVAVPSIIAAQPPPLKPPSIAFSAEPPVVPQVEPQSSRAFAAEWEVDRLAWPIVCERLLETEDRYFRSVGQRLKEATRDGHHVVMITGARRGEGRTTLALCLARCAAQAGVRVAVVDADLDNPQLGNQLGMEPSCSWLETVAGRSPLDEAAVSSLEDGLTLFPLIGSEDSGTPADDPRLTDVLRTIAAHFPLVVVDTGPLTADGRHPFSTGGACPVDTAIVVRDLRNTSQNKTLATAERLQRSGVPAVGIAENFHGHEE